MGTQARRWDAAQENCGRQGPLPGIGVGGPGLRGGGTLDTVASWDPALCVLSRGGHQARATWSPGHSRCPEPLLAFIIKAQRYGRRSSQWPQESLGPEGVPEAVALLTAPLPPGLPAPRAGVSALRELHAVPWLPGPLLRLVHRGGPVSTAAGVSAHPGEAGGPRPGWTGARAEAAPAPAPAGAPGGPSARGPTRADTGCGAVGRPA